MKVPANDNVEMKNSIRREKGIILSGTRGNSKDAARVLTLAGSQRREETNPFGDRRETPSAGTGRGEWMMQSSRLVAQS